MASPGPDCHLEPQRGTGPSAKAETKATIAGDTAVTAGGHCPFPRRKIVPSQAPLLSADQDNCLEEQAKGESCKTVNEAAAGPVVNDP